MLRLYHRTPRQLIKLVNLSGDNNFVFFNTSYRYFFVFLSSICSIQRPNLPCLEQNVLTNTFFFTLAATQDKMADIPHYASFSGPFKMAATC